MLEGAGLGLNKFPTGVDHPTRAAAGNTPEFGGGQTLVKVGLQLPVGLSLDGDAHLGLLVTHVRPGGPAALSKKVRVGMAIVSANGISIVGMDKDAAMTVVKQASEQTKASRTGLIQLILTDASNQYAAYLAAISTEQK